MTSVRQDLGRQLLTAVRWQRDDAEAARLVAAGADIMFDSGDGAGAPLRWAAHAALRVGGTVAPGKMLHQFDWIYEHDVVSGG